MACTTTSTMTSTTRPSPGTSPRCLVFSVGSPVCRVSSSAMQEMACVSDRDSLTREYPFQPVDPTEYQNEWIGDVVSDRPIPSTVHLFPASLVEQHAAVTVPAQMTCVGRSTSTKQRTTWGCQLCLAHSSNRGAGVQVCMQSANTVRGDSCRSTAAILSSFIPFAL